MPRELSPYKMAELKTLCVFCGSSPGCRDIYREQAVELGTLLAKCGIDLVYGAGNIGLMGVLADACLAGGGRVVGVIPGHLVSLEVCHQGLSDLRIVDSMQERKQLMLDLSDAFLALPGGVGTIDEIFEMLVLNQLGIHGKPCGLLNTNGYYDYLIQFLQTMTSERFLLKEHFELLALDNDVTAIVERLTADCRGSSKLAPDDWLERHVNADA